MRYQAALCPDIGLTAISTKVFRFETQGSVSGLGEGKRSETTASERKYCKSTANFRPFARHSTAQCAYASCSPGLLGRGELLTGVAKSQQFPAFAEKIVKIVAAVAAFKS